VCAIEGNGLRRGASVELITKMERCAQEVGEIMRAVSRISDQTTLLALNAVIDAARAGDHGRGFALLTRCGCSPGPRKKKRTKLPKLPTAIQTDVHDIAAALQKAAKTAVNELKASAAVVPTLDGLHAKRTAPVPAELSTRLPSSPSALKISASVAVDFQADGHFDDLRLFPRLAHHCSSLWLNNPIITQEKLHGNWRRRQIPILLSLTRALKA
jgi:hypothetical protein